MPSKSKSQQRLMGSAYAYATGQTKDVPEEIKNVAKSFMKLEKGKKKLRKFAKTKHKNLPEKTKESFTYILHFDKFSETYSV
jgi:hypothetical protein